MIYLVVPKNELQMVYHTIDANGKPVEKFETLQDCLMSDKTPGIDFDHWIENANEQGLPMENSPDGKLYYWYPRDGRVAGFFAGSDRTVLICGRDPTNSNPQLGVRAACAKN
jgi:hypothetical protein